MRALLPTTKTISPSLVTGVMAEWTVILKGPDGSLAYESINADLAAWNDEEKTLDFTDINALSDVVDQFTSLSKRPASEQSDAKAEFTRLLRSVGAATSASFDKASVIGYFRGRRVQ